MPSASASASHYTQLLGDARVEVSNPPIKVNKRIIVCCDGTSDDGIVANEWRYTNVLKFSRAINQCDERSQYAIPQIVFYQSGIGSSPNFYSKYINAITGGSLGTKVQEAYAFIAQNFYPGDEILLFGFSRGAYTARMIAMFIGAIGILDKIDMDNFADIFSAYQKLGKLKDPAEIARVHAGLAPWTSPTSRGKLRALSNDHAFSIKCVGVFDTVGSIGLPEEITRKSPLTESPFGFSNIELGEHIERAYQALAIDENRVDFTCDKFKQIQGGRRKGQVLKQCWFAGQHGDIGGGWREHDLTDLTFFWMVANTQDILSMDLEYIRSIPNPVAPWGKLPPHSTRFGIYALSEEKMRQLPRNTDQVTHEMIHASVLEQDYISPQLRECIQNNPSLVCSLLPFEDEMRRSWPYVPGKNVPVEPRNLMKAGPGDGLESSTLWSATKEILSTGARSGKGIIKGIRTRVVANISTKCTAGQQSSTGAVAKEIVKSTGTRS